MGFSETVQYLYDLQKFGTKLGLENTRALMELLGGPDRGRKFLHVTGTNGKGSVSALSASALIEAGHRTGLYTSPHLVSFTERMKVDGAEVTEDEIVALAERLKALLAENAPELKPTFFEFTTAMAFDWFAKEDADVVVLEVGMGGRLDSTNVVTPECSVITNVELEHREYLGDTIEEIAREKAGIIKPGVPLVTSEKKPGVIKYLEDVCRDLNSPMYLLGRDFGFTRRESGWRDGRYFQKLDYKGPGGGIDGLEIQLIGDHQLENAATAACALSVMSERSTAVGADAIRTGFAATRWEGRLEVVSERPMLVLDGAHNTASAERLAEALAGPFAGRYKRLILVVGVLADKDFKKMLGLLTPFADTVVLTKADYERAVPESELRDALGGGWEVIMKTPVSDALAWALANAGPEDMVLVTGSLYVVGEAKAWLEEREQFLKA
ncbi:MAG: bifunctional folylpolyglutamate synthase/dihydrofolate synthase [Nitrospirae bacterium]|nr:bifunctional folylpolyglutamate synthase/dihydrofolate synthase [Nitrospirota bacterium]